MGECFPLSLGHSAAMITVEQTTDRPDRQKEVEPEKDAVRELVYLVYQVWVSELFL